jgi:hypothetical protein
MRTPGSSSPSSILNGDGYLYIKIIPNGGGSPQFDPAFLYLDNKI